jgi:DNA (cytosine-5)-methyltransferase 1
MTPKLNLLSLFSGIGGFELGLERSGAFETVAQCEIDPFCNKVLAKHWPNVKRYGDVRELTAARLASDGITVDAICGGFPCQDVSIAGKQIGIESGSRSGLWSEYVRLISELEPRFIIMENVSALLSGPSSKPGGWFGRILGDLAELRFNAEWENIPASAVGAIHARERLWLVAYPQSERQERRRVFSFLHKPPNQGLQQRKIQIGQKSYNGICGSVWDANTARIWGMANGVSNRLDRIKSIGNAVVPQIPELIGRAIAASMAHNDAT